MLRLAESDQNDCSSLVKVEPFDHCTSIDSDYSSKIDAAKSLDSSKIKAAIEFLHSIAKPREITMNNDSFSSTGGSVVREKAIVFSQWTRMLDLLEPCLKESSIGYRRLDGTMSIVARDKAVKDFTSLPEVRPQYYCWRS